MKLTITGAVQAALLCTAAIAVSACAYDRRADRDDGYRGTPYYAEDPCTHDSSYCNYPTYEGGIYIEGTWYDGRYRYRDSDHGREYWFNKGWHTADQTRAGDHDADGDDHDGDDHDSDRHDHDHDHDGDSH